MITIILQAHPLSLYTGLQKTKWVVFANGPGDWGLIPGCVIWKTPKIALDATLITLSIIRYRSRVKWSSQGKGVALFLHLNVVANFTYVISAESYLRKIPLILSWENFQLKKKVFLLNFHLAYLWNLTKININSSAPDALAKHDAHGQHAGSSWSPPQYHYFFTKSYP